MQKKLQKLKNFKRKREILTRKLKYCNHCWLNWFRQEDSYENALAEETEMMKAAFQVKIKKLQDELATLKKKHSEDVIELKLKLQKEQETKDLLLKKLQIQAKV